MSPWNDSLKPGDACFVTIVADDGRPYWLPAVVTAIPTTTRTVDDRCRKLDEKNGGGHVTCCSCSMTTKDWTVTMPDGVVRVDVPIPLVMDPDVKRAWPAG